MRQGQLGGHKHRKILVLENQEQRWKNSTPNRQMQHFLHYKIDPHLISQHKVQCNYIDVVCIVNVFTLLFVFYTIFFYFIAIEFHFLISDVPIYSIHFWGVKSYIVLFT